MIFRGAMLPRLFFASLAAASAADLPASGRSARDALHRALRELDLCLLRLDRELERGLRAAAEEWRTVERAAALLGAPVGPPLAPAAVGDSVPRLLPVARRAALVPLGRAVTDDGWSLVTELAASPRSFEALGLGVPDRAPRGWLRRPFEATPELIAHLHRQARRVDRLWRDVAWVQALLQGLDRDVRRLVARVEQGAPPAQVLLLRSAADALASLLATPLLAPEELRLSVAAFRLLHGCRRAG